VAKWRVRGVGNADFYRMDKQKPQWVPSGAEPECTTTTTSSTPEQWACWHSNAHAVQRHWQNKGRRRLC